MRRAVSLLFMALAAYVMPVLMLRALVGLVLLLVSFYFWVTTDIEECVRGYDK